VSTVRSRGPIVIDTDVVSADLVPGSRLAERYTSFVTDGAAFISFQTFAELRYGAIRRGWGHARTLRLEAKVQRVEVVHSHPSSLRSTPQLRVDCEAAGHALGQKPHTGDRWIAAIAIRLGIPAVSNDGIFRGAPGLELKTRASG
jgi:predicted nucleic acid-binding protein